MADIALPIENNAYQVEGGSILAKLNLSEITNYLEDDWGDNALTSRSSTSDGVFAHPDANEAGDVLIGRYRPEWNTTAGTASVSSGAVNLDGGDEIVTNSTFSVGALTVDCTVGGTGWLLFKGASQSTYPFRTLGFHDSSGRNERGLAKNDGSFVWLIKAGADFTGTTVTIKITRDSYANLEYFEDGTSQGTTTDTYIPSPPLCGIYGDFSVTNWVMK